MAAQIIFNTQVFVNQFDLSTLTAQLDETIHTDTPDMNNVAGGGYVHLLPGLCSAQWSISGLYDTATNGSYAAFTGAQRGRQDVVGYNLLGTSAVEGSPVYFMRGQLKSFEAPQGGVGETARFSGSWEADTGMVAGVVGAPLASRSATFTGSGVQLGAVSTSVNGATERLWAALFVTAASGTNLAVTIQSDTVGFPSPASAATFTTVSAVGAQFLTVAGPITDDYFRVNATIGTGSFSYCVMMGVY